MLLGDEGTRKSLEDMQIEVAQQDNETREMLQRDYFMR